MNLFSKSFRIQRVVLDTLGYCVVPANTCDSPQATNAWPDNSNVRRSSVRVRLVAPSPLFVDFMRSPKISEIQNPKCGKGDQMADYGRLTARIAELRNQNLSFAKIAEQLNHDGFHPVKQADKFHSNIVSRLVRQLDRKLPGSRAKALTGILNENEWFVVDLASQLKTPKNTLLAWIKRGWVRVARQLPGYRGRVICWADAEELHRLRHLRQTKHGWWDPPLPAELTTPKPVRQN
jgi:hypothetical protein